LADNWRSEMNSRYLSRLLKFGISLLFFGVIFLRDRLMSLLGHAKPGGCVVLYYHAVAKKHRELFARQMDLILRCAKPIPANQEEPCGLGGRYVAVTFDDGLESVLENALPELESRRIPSTMFIVVQALGDFPCWMPDSPRSDPTQKVMSIEQLRHLSSELVTVGSHTLTHPNLCLVDQAQACREISDSRTELQRILNIDVSLFSFPYGAFNSTLIQTCRDAGYERVFTTLPVLAFGGLKEFVSGRVTVEPTDWPIEFRLKILGAYRWLPLAFALKRKLRSGFSADTRSGMQEEL
jgi:peptidoglycan/xylan/chitin deacetylase (PgdA/CDA1 family)